MTRSQEYCHEPARVVPIVAQADVIVCGGGPAGVAAAVAAARAGARTHLLEKQGCLGGVWTAGLLSHIIDAHNKTGIMSEILQRLRTYAGVGPDGNSYQPEVMKLVLEEMCLRAGVHVRLHTWVVAAQCGANNRLHTILTESKSGREAWCARMFVDCSGNGDLAFQAGCGFDLGHPQTGQCQPMSLMAILTGCRDEEITPYICGPVTGHVQPKLKLLAELERANVSPSYTRPTLFGLGGSLLAFMANHQYGVYAADAGQITTATIEARAEVHRLVHGLRGLGGVWRDIRIVATADQIGVREGRRIHGRYTVTEQDVANGARHDDAICRAAFCVDVHATDPRLGKAYGSEGRKSQPYDIPLRALMARDVDGLLLAGRCISGDFIAHASYRVTGNAVAMGQAAGIAAAWAAKANRALREEDCSAVLPLLRQSQNPPAEGQRRSELPCNASA